MRRTDLTMLLLLSALSMSVLAQTNTVELVGVVRDPQRFFLPALRVGIYAVTAELSGFKRLVRSGVILQLGQELLFTRDFGPRKRKGCYPSQPTNVASTCNITSESAPPASPRNTSLRTEVVNPRYFYTFC
jgi:hypothetical protein